jgi:hypothetical protein
MPAATTHVKVSRREANFPDFMGTPFLTGFSVAMNFAAGAEDSHDVRGMVNTG